MPMMANSWRRFGALKLVLLSVAMTLAAVAMAQDAATTPQDAATTPQGQGLTKDQVIQMTKAGLSEEVIVARVNAEPSPVKLSADDLIAMKSAGVSDGVIRALLAPKTPAAAPAAAPPPPPDPNDPNSPHDPGIYLLTNDNERGGKKMILIERAGSGHEKTANIWGHAFSYGISKAKIKAEVPGAHAMVRSHISKPEFYMYFPPTGNLGAADTITSPSQFSLLSLEEKKDHRETAVAQVGFASASAGTDNKHVFKLSAEKVRAYVYRVLPDTELKEGEYAFVAATGMGGPASGSSVVIYDFGVDLK